MPKILTQGEGRNFECALHFCVTDEDERWLYAASFVGFPSAAWAVGAAIKSGRAVMVQVFRKELWLSPWSSLWHLDRRAGDRLVHVMVLPRPVPLLDEKDNHPAVVLAWDGDVERAAGEYLAARFDLPWEEEWIRQYHRFFETERLKVIKSPFTEEHVPQAVVLRRNYWGFNRADVDQTIGAALERGDLRVPCTGLKGRYEKGQSLQDYLRANAHVFASQVAQVMPLHNPEAEKKLDPAIVMDRVPFPAQAHAAEAIAKLLQTSRTAICSSDMGTGKSIIALGVASVLYRRQNKRPMTVLVTSPGMVVPKWCEHEIRSTLPDAKVVKVGSSDEAARWAKEPDSRTEVVTAAQYLNQVRSGYRPEGLEFVVMGIDRAKLGPQSWWVCVHWKRRKGEKKKGWHCPDCNGLLTRKLDREVVPLSWYDFISPKHDGASPGELFTAAGLPRKGVRIWWQQKPPVRKCPRCGAVLVRPALKSRGETNLSPRWYAALTMKKLRRHFGLYVADEVHQSKADNSGRGFAFAELVGTARKVLCLTGTLVNGMSSSVKEILWRTNPRALLGDGFNAETSAVAWAARYGVLERVIDVDTGDEGMVTRRKRYQERQARERPGISPELVANHLLHQGVFLELSDLQLPLVKLEEKPVIVQLDDEHLEAYRRFHEELRAACKKAMQSGEKGAFAKFIPATINAVDRADAGLVVEVGDEAVEFPAFGPDCFTAKERELVHLVRENLAEDRGCIVYCFYTDKYSVHRRLRDVLRKHGIEAVVLESHVPQEERIVWLEGQARKGAKVIITNMRLVECGLDLLPWPTFIFYQMNYDVNTLRQASRRAWRIGQTRECRVYYLVADGTQQVSQMEVCLEKRAHAMLAEGRLDKAEMSRYVQGTRMSLAADIAQCIASEDIGLRWTDLAVKDLDQVEMVDEARFREVLRQAHERLANETLRLCGLAAEEDAEAVVEPEQPASFAALYADLASAMPRRRRRKRVDERQITLFDLLGVTV